MYLNLLSTQRDMWVNTLQETSASKKKKSKRSKVLKKAKKKALKAASTEATPSERPNPVENGMWKGFNLIELGVPLEAYPKSDREHKGKCGYTVSATNGSVPNWILESFVIDFKRLHPYLMGKQSTTYGNIFGRKSFKCPKLVLRTFVLVPGLIKRMQSMLRFWYHYFPN